MVEEPKNMTEKDSSLDYIFAFAATTGAVYPGRKGRAAAPVQRVSSRIGGGASRAAAALAWRR